MVSESETRIPFSLQRLIVMLFENEEIRNSVHVMKSIGYTLSYHDHRWTDSTYFTLIRRDVASSVTGFKS